jgi:hypothetical protein
LWLINNKLKIQRTWSTSRARRHFSKNTLSAWLPYYCTLDRTAVSSAINTESTLPQKNSEPYMSGVAPNSEIHMATIQALGMVTWPPCRH